MQPKKHPKSDLERRRFSFFKIGLITVLALVWMALEWKSYEKSPFDLGNLMMDDVEEEIVPPTFPKEKPPPPPPPPSPPEPIDDDKEVEEEYEVKDESIDENAEIEPFPEEEVDFEEPDIFISVEEMPSFGKGYADLMKYFKDCIKYPEMARDIGIDGKVYLKFVVDEKGEVSNVIIQRGLGYGCDKVAVNCVKNMPKWNPGKQRGIPVKVWFSLPVKFKLR